MIKPNKLRMRVLGFALIASLNFTAVVRGQDVVGVRNNDRQQRKQIAKDIEVEVRNGIFVDTPKVYDDSSLQLMLNSARARLAAIQGIDQAGLTSKIGAVTGASLDQSALGVQFTGPPVPGVQTTANGGTNQTTTSTANGGTTSTVSNQPVQNTVTTNPQSLASVPAPPQNAATLPSTFSVSALDALNEQMQLTYEIANLQLLLEGSLNDRFVTGQRFVKPRTTLGFPITIAPQKAYKDALAVVEISVQNPPGHLHVTLGSERPAVTALLPREKTYNVAAVTDHMKSIGAGFVSQVINGGFSYLHGRKSYYIVQDQDTLAVMLPPGRSGSDAPPDVTRFSWQFRPVLGQPFVKAGFKQTFVQLAAPVLASTGCFGEVKIRTYWQKFDRKTGVLKEVIPDSIVDQSAFQPIPSFDLSPVVESLNVSDLGAGQVLAAVGGKFLGGTYVRVGNNYYKDGSPGFTSDLTQIRFVAAAADIAKYRAYLVSRDGSETEILDPADPDARPVQLQDCATTDPGKKITTGNLEISLDRRQIDLPQGGKTEVIASVKAQDDVEGDIRFVGTGVPDGMMIVHSRSSQRLTLAEKQAKQFPYKMEIAVPSHSLSGTFPITITFKKGNDSAQVSLTVVVHPAPNATVEVGAYDNSNSIVIANLCNVPEGPKANDYLLVIGSRVYGLSDAPIERVAGDHSLTLKVVVPTSLISSAAQVQAKPLFWKPEYGTTSGVDSYHIESTTDKIAVLKQEANSTTFLLYGNRLAEATIIVPANLKLEEFTDDVNTFRQFTVEKAGLANLKQIVLVKKAGERPVFVSMPQPDSAPKNTLTVGGRITTGTDEVTVTGDTFDNLKSVSLDGTPVTWVPVVGNKSVKLTGLAAKVTKNAGTPELLFQWEGEKKGTLKLDVVDKKVEFIKRDQP